MFHSGSYIYLKRTIQNRSFRGMGRIILEEDLQLYQSSKSRFILGLEAGRCVCGSVGVGVISKVVTICCWKKYWIYRGKGWVRKQDDLMTYMCAPDIYIYWKILFLVRFQVLFSFLKQKAETVEEVFHLRLPRFLSKICLFPCQLQEVYCEICHQKYIHVEGISFRYNMLCTDFQHVFPQLEKEDSVPHIPQWFCQYLLPTLVLLLWKGREDFSAPTFWLLAQLWPQVFWSWSQQRFC